MKEFGLEKIIFVCTDSTEIFFSTCQVFFTDSYCAGVSNKHCLLTFFHLHMRIRCGSLSITTPVSLLANKFDVRNILHGQVSSAAVNHICVIHEAMNSYKNLKIH